MDLKLIEAHVEKLKQQLPDLVSKARLISVEINRIEGAIAAYEDVLRMASENVAMGDPQPDGE